MTIASGPLPPSAIANVATQSRPPTISDAVLHREYRSAKVRSQARALALIAPLALFLLIIFVVPIAALLLRSVQNPEVVTALPRTTVALAKWDRQSQPSAEAFLALTQDLTHADDRSIGALARRLNSEASGSLSLINKTARVLSESPAPQASPPSAEAARAQTLQIDERWSELKFWQAIARNSSPYTAYYLLASVDFKQGATGQIERADSDHRIYVTVFGRTFLISLVVTLLALALGYPIAYWISTLSASRANLFMIIVLIPFWTSILVRCAAWIVLLQSKGLINSALIGASIIREPLTLLFNRSGVYISMTHILLPFMILPLYSVMKSISPSYVRAAISLGSHPFAAFWRVYVPQTLPGVGAGVLLVFILALGYYITPALLGGPDDQMVSYYVAFFTNVTIVWGMACALAALLLVATLALYAVYQRLIRPRGDAR